MKEQRSQLIEKLSLYGEQFVIEQQKIVIKTDAPLYVYVVFEKDKVRIYGKMMRWNVLTGFLKMELTASYRYLTIVVFLLVIMLFGEYLWLLSTEATILRIDVSFYLALLFLVVTWVSISLVRFEILFQSKKRQLMNWLS